jgi:uncharacterized protein YegP (UPF0339 family)
MTATIYVDLIKTPVIKRLLGRPQQWRWKAFNAGNMRVLAVSSENYTNRQDCIDAIGQLFGAGSAAYMREAEHGNTSLRLAQDHA